jgi:hypothetical protein
MKLRVLALDYDGTIAREGALSSDVRSAIAEARAGGVVVLIVTGRILAELQRVAGDLKFVDAVVAENGAVLEFPDAQTRILGQLPPQVFFDELRRRGVASNSGQCIVEAEASAAPAILVTIRELQLPLIILFNRSRLMVLPQAVSKGTGLQNALRILRLSRHNAIAIGDAENDHDLLAQCELAAAVGWGSSALQAAADEVVNGDGPSAVAAYIRRAIAQTQLSPARIGRHQFTLGTDQDGRPVTADVSGANVLILGDSQSGKSWMTGLLCEQLIIQDYSLCVIDPEGDYSGLEALPGVLVLTAAERPPELADVARAIRHFDLSVVVDLSHIHLEEKLAYLKALLPMLASIRRETGLPHRIVVDEAHYFLREPNVKQLLDLQLGAYTIVTYRPSDLHPDLSAAIDVVIVKRLTKLDELEALKAIVKNAHVELHDTAIVGTLATNEGAVARRDADGRLRRFSLLPRLTAHVRHREKYFDSEVDSGQEFVFTDNGQPIGSPARSLRQIAGLIQAHAADSIGDHAGRGDFSRWISNVFQDYRLASDVRKIEQQYRLNHLEDVRQPIAALILEKYKDAGR